MHFDLLVVIPLEVEWQELLKVFPTKVNHSEGHRVRYELDTGCEVSLLAVLQDEQGCWSASSTTKEALAEHHASLLVSLGIAGGVSNDVSLGDVCYTGTVIDTTGNAKVIDSGKKGQDIDLAADFFSTPKYVYGPFAFPRVMPELQANYRKWQEQQALEALSLCDTSEHWDTCRLPESFAGDIGCGMVGASVNYKRKLKSIQRKILALDTESGAVFRCAEDAGISALTIRGISDLADAGKAELEKATADCLRTWAASNAATFLKLQLGNPYFREWLSSQRPSGPQFPFQSISTPSNRLADLQREALATSEERLRQSSEAFRGQREGIMLPLPRLRPSGKTEGTSQQRGPIEFKTAVQAFRRLVIKVPRAFPDKGLAWLLAYHLCYELGSGQVLLPIVIEGRSVRPPRGTFQRLSPVDLQEARAVGAEPVLIIDGFNSSSSTGRRFLLDEMRAEEESRVVVLVEDTSDLSGVEELSLGTSAGLFSLADISFAETTDFVTRHYEMPGTEAEVIALRLREIFRRFHLPAHPTYFAGIPQELLASLLNANRRAELIQLAVDGFLTLVVSLDTTPGRLSRTTRAEFLRRLVREIHVEKRKLDLDALYEFAGRHFRERGYPNDPETFIRDFFARGILIIEDDRTGFGLPFMEAYFLALELAQTPQDAASFFDPDDIEFDTLTFDLYCEIGPAEILVDKLLCELVSNSHAERPEGWESTCVLTSQSIQPALLRKKGQVEAFQNRLQAATKAVIEGAGDKEKKQQLLDIADRISEEVTERRREEQRDDDSGGLPPEFEAMGRRIRIWSLAVIMIGQGSERLSAVKKNELAQLVISEGACLMADWVALINQVPFGDVKSDLIKSYKNGELRFDLNDTDSDLSGEQMISAIIDLMEMTFLSNPVRSVLSHLATEGRQPVLHPAIERSGVKGPISTLIRANWLLDTGAASASSEMRSIIRTMPAAPFFRTAIASHNLIKVYWDMSDKSQRLLMLQVADDLMKPLGKGIPVGEIQRQLEDKDKPTSDQ